METKDKIDLGQKIRDEVFEGNNYAQLGYLMEGVKALSILIDIDATTEEKEWANSKLEELKQIESKINSIKGE